MNELTQMNEMLRDVEQAPQRFVAVKPALVAAPRIDRRPVPVDRSQLPAGDRAALLIGTAIHDHEAYPELSSAGAGVRQMKHVLERPDVGMMDTCLVIGDATHTQMMRGIEAFLSEREHGDTVVVYVSGYAEVSATDGRLYLVSKDSDPDDLEHTAVPADFLRRQLQECRATSKVVLLDYGARAVATEHAAPSAWLEPAGTYVIAASEALLHRVPADSDAMSGFTAEIVDGLSAGRAKSGLGPWVTADDLAGYLAQRLGGDDVPRRARPVTSTLAVTGNHVIARSTVRAVSLLDNRAHPGRRPAQPAGPDVDDAGWRELAAYYRACLADARSPVALPARDDAEAYVPITSGPEMLFSGKSSTTTAPDGVDTFDWKERELWYGYPLVTLAGGGRRHSASPLAQVTVAPLLVQRVEVTVDARGAAALRPTGPIMPHAGVLQACLDDQEAASVLESWQPLWRSDGHDQMLVAVRQLMKRLGLGELETLDPAALTGDGITSATRTGVHNTAAVLYVESTRAAAIAVSAELAAIGDDADRIPGTVLEHLTAPAGHRAPGVQLTDAAPLAVTPDELSESGEAVLHAAMNQPLTVATTPPGTDKQALVVDAVATALAAGQKVLYVGPDDRAVQNVVDWCSQLAPGMMIRTGDAQARAEEKQLLRDLTRSARDPQRRRPRSEVLAELAAARADVETWRAGLSRRSGVETALRKTCSARAAAADRLDVDVHALDSAWRDDDAALAEWIERARALDAARILRGWRRRRAAGEYLRAVSAGDADPGDQRRRFAEPEAFESLLLFARAEQRMRTDRRDVETVDDTQLDEQGRALFDRCRRLSAELVDVVVGEQVEQAEATMLARRMALEPGGRDRQASQRELVQQLGGWAVTVADAEQLALEPGLFDLVVVDDAHEIDVAAVLPVLFRARRALVLGDPVRSKPRVRLSDHRHRRAREHGGLSAGWLEQRRLSHQTHSAYDAVAVRAPQVELLDEHDGCHPDIARIFDDALYDGRLTVTTDVRALRRARDPETFESTLLLWEDVHGTPEPGPNGGSWRSQAEIDRVVWAVYELRDQLPEGARVSVVTPFRAQAEELRSLFRFEPIQVHLPGDTDLAASDAVVVSLVAGEGMPEQTVRWVESLAPLWSAALTRAGAHVVTVGRHAFWSTRSGPAATLARLSSVRSFHVHPIPPQRPADDVVDDSLAELLHQRLEQAGYDRIEHHALLDGYRCDVLVGTAEGGTAVLLDRGPAAGADAASHLRRMMERCHLLEGLQPDTASGIGPVTRVLRVPAWRVRSGEAIPGLID